MPVDRVAAGILAALTAPEAIGARIHLATDNRIRSEEICRIAQRGARGQRAPRGPDAVPQPDAAAREGRAARRRASRSWRERRREARRRSSASTASGASRSTTSATTCACWACRSGGRTRGRRSGCCAGTTSTSRSSAKVRDPDEIARRERLWEQAIDAIEYETGRQVGGDPARASSASCWPRRSSSPLQGRSSAAGAAAAGVSSGVPPAVARGASEGARMSETPAF